MNSSQNDAYSIMKLKESELKAEQQKPERLRSDIDELIFQLKNHDEKISGIAQSLQMLQDKMEALEKRIAAKKSSQNALYIWPLLVAILFTAVLVWRGWAATPTVSIDFNVGEIIGGVLAGVGALIAAVAYSNRRES